jgi:hypothetical protein
MHRVAPQRLARVRATRSARLVVWSSGARALAGPCGATRRAESVDARRGVLPRSWTDVHSLAPPCAARPQAQRGVCGDIKQALRPHGVSGDTHHSLAIWSGSSDRGNLSARQTFALASPSPAHRRTPMRGHPLQDRSRQFWHAWQRTPKRASISSAISSFMPTEYRGGLTHAAAGRWKITSATFSSTSMSTGAASPLSSTRTSRSRPSRTPSASPSRPARPS